MENFDTDVLIIGAGPAGTSAASLLHSAGFKVEIIEKQVFPRFVIGESLLPRCMDLLEEANLLEAVKAQGYIYKGGASFFRGTNEQCRFDFSDQFTKGWKYTYQVPRDHFDNVLAETVRDMGVNIRWGYAVTNVEFTDSGPITTIDDDNNSVKTISSRFIMDASGFGRVLPNLLGLNKPSTLPERQSIFTHMEGDIRPPGKDEGKIWICMHPDQMWIWIIPFSNGKTSVGVVGKPELLVLLGYL